MDEEFKIDKRKDLSKRENNPGFKACMHCGGELPPNEDGSVKFRKFPEPCYECINARKDKMVVNGKEVEIPGGYGSKFIESVRSQ